jgi:heme-degrading monooxygenase HmoA
MTAVAEIAVQSQAFAAVNFITCRSEYAQRFADMFQTRAHAIDRLDGFRGMYVLAPNAPGKPYLVISHWESEDHFKAWTKSPEFLEGHKRAFADMKAAQERGEEPPMHSQFETYTVLAL